MSTQELRLRYFIQLASNIGLTAKREAQEFERSQDQMTRATRQTDRSAKDLHHTLTTLANNTSMERQVGYFDRLSASVERAHQRARQFKQTMMAGAQALPELALQGAAGYYAGRALVAPPVRAYADLEEATTGLKTAMLDAKLQVNKAFPAIAKKAEELGNKLPGSTKDFFQGATELIRQGVSPELVAGGALEASAKFGVLMKMNQGQAAATIAKVREAYGLQANELPQMADLMQRTAFASGVNPQDFLITAGYAAPTYNTMKLSGLGKARELLALQGLAAGVGLEGSSFGTNFSQMLSRLSQTDSRLSRKSPEAKQVRELLASHGIDMSFYGADGEFKGTENMLAELAKLRKLSTVDKQHVTKTLFGDEAGRPAQILADKGLEAYREQLQRMDSQASLDQRLDLVMTTFAAKLESLGGTITNVMAQIATPLGNAAKPMMDRANGFLGGFGGFVSDNPVAGTAGLLGVGLGGAVGAWRGSGALFNMVRGGSAGLGAGVGASAATAAAVAAASNPFRGLGVTMPAPAAAPSMLSRLAGAGRFLGPGLAVAGAGLESYDVLTNEQLTAMGKARGVTMAAAGAGGALLGAKAGAMLGTAVLPGFGTLAGGLIGGAGGYLLGKYGSGQLWGADPERDYIKVSGANGAKLGAVQPGGQATVQLGEGVLQVQITVNSDGTYGTTANMSQPMQLLRVEAGSTNPGSFASTAGGFR